MFCLPYAGGASDLFRDWRNALPPSIEVCPIELPGRGSRSKEKPHTDLAGLVQILGSELRTWADRPFALFGHSMGAVIAFELARYLRREYDREATHLFVSACRAPHRPMNGRPSYDLPDADFVNKVRDLGGTAPSVLQNRRFIKTVLPLLRADFKLIQTYVYKHDIPLSCPITVFGGAQDTMASLEDLNAWSEHTVSKFSLQILGGTHFFLNTHRSALLSMLRREFGLDATAPPAAFEHPGM